MSTRHAPPEAPGTGTTRDAATDAAGGVSIRKQAPDRPTRDKPMAYTLITDATDEVVSTDERPIIKTGLSLRLECRSCGDVFDQGDAGQTSPGGHKKFVEYKCPECGARTARKWGTNREVDEQYLSLSVREAFDKRVEDDRATKDTEGVDDPDDAVLVGGSEVDPDDVGDDVIAAFEYYPAKGVTNFLTVDADDVDHDTRRDEVPATVEWFDGHHKPVGYPAEWDNDLPEDGGDLRPTDHSILRLVRIE